MIARCEHVLKIAALQACAFRRGSEVRVREREVSTIRPEMLVVTTAVKPSLFGVISLESK